MTYRLPPFSAIRAFEAAARHLSFKHAAEELALTPSAVSHQVKNLEDHLGLLMFRRTGRALELTDAGRAYLPAVSGALEQLAAATAQLGQADNTNTLTVSTTPSFAGRWLIPRLMKLQAEEPDLDVRLSTSLEVVDLRRDDIDMAIRWGDGEFSGLDSAEVVHEVLCPVCIPQIAAELNTPQDLKGMTLLHNRLYPGAWDMWLRSAGIEDEVKIKGRTFESFELALAACEAGFGVFVSSYYLMEDILRSGRLVRPFDQELNTDTGYYLVWPSERSAQPKIARFRDWISAEAARTLGETGYKPLHATD